jgi:hypothetical protein
MGERGREVDEPARLIDRRGLDGGDLVLAQRLAHNLETTREWCIAESPLLLPSPLGPNRRGQRLLRIDQLGLRLGQG